MKYLNFWAERTALKAFSSCGNNVRSPKKQWRTSVWESVLYRTQLLYNVVLIQHEKTGDLNSEPNGEKLTEVECLRMAL